MFEAMIRGVKFLFGPLQKEYNTGTRHKAYHTYFIIYLISSHLCEGHV